MKYLITEADINYLVANCFYQLHAKAIAASLKPIKPLTIEQIEECCTTEVNRTEMNFCRAIEAHILGEKHDS